MIFDLLGGESQPSSDFEIRGVVMSEATPGEVGVLIFNPETQTYSDLNITVTLEKEDA